MKISPISFKKSFIKNCALPSTVNGRELCKIYKLDLPEDCDYFAKARQDSKWNGNRLLEEADMLDWAVENENDYVMENESGDCLGYVITFDDKIKNQKDVMYLETCPYYAKSNPERTLKYIGETLLALVTELAAKDNYDRVCIPFAMKKSSRFYGEKCGFQDEYYMPNSKRLVKKDFQTFINQNKEHTKI